MKLPSATLLLLGALFCSFPVHGEPAAVSAETKRLLPEFWWDEDLPPYNYIGGRCIGGAGGPCSFHIMAVEAIQNPAAGEAQFQELTRHSVLGTRIIGMAGLAKLGTPTGIQRLRELLTSRESTFGYPGGCLDEKITEAATAWQFLTSTGWLCCCRTTALLDEKASLALAFDVLWRDDCAGVRVPGRHAESLAPPVELICKKVTEGRLIFRITSLQTAAPGLEPWQVVKAAGRLPATLAAPFLIEVAHDKTADAKCRLAAASALLRMEAKTKYGFESAALRSVKADLDALGMGSWGTAFCEISHGRWTDERRISYARPRDLFLTAKDAIIPVSTSWAMNVHLINPETLSELDEFTAALRKDPAPFSRWRADWNAFGDTLFQLEITARQTSLEGEPLISPEPARKALLEAVAAALGSPVPAE